MPKETFFCPYPMQHHILHIKFSASTQENTKPLLSQRLCCCCKTSNNTLCSPEVWRQCKDTDSHLKIESLKFTCT
jgi:hypothetical protein